MSKQVDWSELARRFQQAMMELVHLDPQPRYGDELYAEALRRALGWQEQGPGGHPPYETVRFPGLLTEGEHEHVVHSHTVVDRLNAERVTRENKEIRERYRVETTRIRAELAQALRASTNERTVPSRYRREGVLLAADWLDPQCPASPFTSVPAGTPPRPR